MLGKPKKRCRTRRVRHPLSCRGFGAGPEAAFAQARREPRNGTGPLGRQRRAEFGRLGGRNEARTAAHGGRRFCRFVVRLGARKCKPLALIDELLMAPSAVVSNLTRSSLSFQPKPSMTSLPRYSRSGSCLSTMSISNSVMDVNSARLTRAQARLMRSGIAILESPDRRKCNYGRPCGRRTVWAGLRA